MLASWIMYLWGEFAHEKWVHSVLVGVRSPPPTRSGLIELGQRYDTARPVAGAVDVN